jgi:hypothetical protein
VQVAVVLLEDGVGNHHLGTPIALAHTLSDPTPELRR